MVRTHFFPEVPRNIQTGGDVRRTAPFCNPSCSGLIEFHLHLRSDRGTIDRTAEGGNYCWPVPPCFAWTPPHLPPPLPFTGLPPVFWVLYWPLSSHLCRHAWTRDLGRLVGDLPQSDQGRCNGPGYLIAVDQQFFYHDSFFRSMRQHFGLPVTFADSCDHLSHLFSIHFAAGARDPGTIPRRDRDPTRHLTLSVPGFSAPDSPLPAAHPGSASDPVLDCPGMILCFRLSAEKKRPIPLTYIFRII